MLGGVLINQCTVQNDVFLLNCSLNPLTGSCSSSNKLTTTMLMSVPMVPSLKRLETCNIGDYSCTTKIQQMSNLPFMSPPTERNIK